MVLNSIFNKNKNFIYFLRPIRVGGIFIMKKFIVALGFVVSACQSQETVPQVYANAETDNCIALQEEDAADDPAFWLNESNPENSLVFGTNKKYGLEVYNLSGERIADYPIGRLNNVDVSLNVPLFDTLIDIVAASNRDYDRIDIWAIDSMGEKLTLISDTTMKTHLEGVYGFCLWNDELNGRAFAFVNNKDGMVEQWELLFSSTQVTFTLVRAFEAAGQVEGMVIDQNNRLLYLGEEQGGIFAYNLDDADVPRFRIAMSGDENEDLSYDIEGLAIFSNDSIHLLLASSQGNFKYAVFDISNNYNYLGVFEIADGTFDGAEETDGIDIYSGPVGDMYPKGILIAQDGFNKNTEGKAVPQNFKIVDWRQIEAIFN